jgi:hypothetical protein
LNLSSQFFKEFLVFPLNYKKTIAFLSTADVKKSWKYEIDWKFQVNDAKPKMFLDNNIEETEKNQEKENVDKPVDDKELQLLAVSEAHNLLSFTSTEKSIFLCKIEESSVVVLSRRIFLRTASKLRFSSCGKFLFLADKTGDTFEYSCEDVNKPPRWIFGHISQILDLKVSADLR